MVSVFRIVTLDLKKADFASEITNAMTMDAGNVAQLDSAMNAFLTTQDNRYVNGSNFFQLLSCRFLLFPSLYTRYYQ